MSGVRVHACISAVEHLRPFRGGAQAHLLRASDGNWYVTKFQNKTSQRQPCRVPKRDLRTHQD